MSFNHLCNCWQYIATTKNIWGFTYSWKEVWIKMIWIEQINIKNSVWDCMSELGEALLIGFFFNFHIYVHSYVHYNNFFRIFFFNSVERKWKLVQIFWLNNSSSKIFYLSTFFYSKTKSNFVSQFLLAHSQCHNFPVVCPDLMCPLQQRENHNALY